MQDRSRKGILQGWERVSGRGFPERCAESFLESRDIIDLNHVGERQHELPVGAAPPVFRFPRGVTEPPFDLSDIGIDQQGG